MKKSVREAYGTKQVNPKYYSTITVSGGTTGITKTLTKEEFMQGKQGLVWADNKTGQLIFDEEDKPLGIMEQIRQREANKPPVSIEEELQKMNEASRKPKNMTIYGGFEFIKKLRKALPNKYL